MGRKLAFCCMTQQLESKPFARPRIALRVLSWQVLVFSGLALAVLFHLGFAFPLRTGIVLLALLTLWGIWTTRTSGLSLLPRFMIAVYSLPFSVLLGYIINPDFMWIFTPRGMEISADLLIIRQMATVGMVGLLGLLAGIRSVAVFRPHNARTGGEPTILHRPSRTLAAPVFAVLLPVSIFFSWLSAPPETIFEAAYASGQSGAVAASINFPAAYMVSYILMVILFIDAERERGGAGRRTKFLAIGLGTVYIVVVLQLLRGDRESSGLVVALTALYLTSPAGIRHARRLVSVARSRIRRLVLPLVTLLTVFIAIGSLRSRLSEAGKFTEILTPVQAVQLGLSQNTWTAILWTNLGVAWEYRQGLLTYKYGATYTDYLLSLPPGVVTNALGLERPLESWRGIAWEDAAGVSGGGLHVVVVPFRNFGAFGVFIVLLLYGLIIGRVEQRGETGTLGPRVLRGSVFCGGFLWFWYGDMSFIRALMIAGLLYVVYRIGLSVQLGSPRAALSTARIIER